MKRGYIFTHSSKKKMFKFQWNLFFKDKKERFCQKRFLRDILKVQIVGFDFDKFLLGLLHITKFEEQTPLWFMEFKNPRYFLKNSKSVRTLLKSVHS